MKQHKALSDMALASPSRVSLERTGFTLHHGAQMIYSLSNMPAWHAINFHLRMEWLPLKYTVGSGGVQGANLANRWPG